MQKIINIIQLVCNVALLLRIYYKLSIEDLSKLSYTNDTNDLSQEIFFLQILQVAQGTDFFFSKGSIFAILLQYSSRVFLSILFMDAHTSAQTLYILLPIWLLADSIRFAFYTFKNEVISVLRYNMFIVLYPIGVAHEEVVLFNWERVHGSSNEIMYYMSWFNRIGLVLGLPILYLMMLKNRSRYYKKLREARKAKKVEQETPKEKTN